MGDEGENVVLRTEYAATTNRMLRVAVNGFMESIAVVIQVMAELDIDAVDDHATKREEKGLEATESLEKVQGLVDNTTGRAWRMGVM